MSNINSVLHFSNLTVGATGIVHAKLHLGLADVEPFPGQGWTDFASVVLAWWSQGLARMLEARSMRERFNFMDGPFEFELDASEGLDRARIALSEERSSGSRVVARSVIELPSFAAEVLRSGESCCRKLKAAEVSNADREALQGALAELRRALAAYERARLG